jgi:hypothetical protein
MKKKARAARAAARAKKVRGPSPLGIDRAYDRLTLVPFLSAGVHSARLPAGLVAESST